MIKSCSPTSLLTVCSACALCLLLGFAGGRASVSQQEQTTHRSESPQAAMEGVPGGRRLAAVCKAYEAHDGNICMLDVIDSLPPGSDQYSFLCFVYDAWKDTSTGAELFCLAHRGEPYFVTNVRDFKASLPWEGDTFAVAGEMKKQLTPVKGWSVAFESERALVESMGIELP